MRKGEDMKCEGLVRDAGEGMRKGEGMKKCEENEK